MIIFRKRHWRTAKLFGNVRLSGFRGMHRRNWRQIRQRARRWGFLETEAAGAAMLLSCYDWDCPDGDFSTRFTPFIQSRASGIVLKLLQLFRVLPGSRFVECGGFCVVRFRRYFLDSSMVWETERPAKWESCIFGSIANGGLAFWIHRGGGGFRGGSTVTKNIMQ